MALLCSCSLAKSGWYSFRPVDSLGCSNGSTGLKEEKTLLCIIFIKYDDHWQFLVVYFVFAGFLLCLFVLFFFIFFSGGVGGGGGGLIEKLRRKTRKQLSSFSFSIHARNISNIAYTCCRDRLHLILSGGQISKLI